MSFAYLAIFSNLVFIPNLFDAHSPPKRLFILLLAILALPTITNNLRWQSLPLAYPILFYLGLSLLSTFGVINWLLFLDRFSLEIACFILFWVTAMSKPNENKILWFSIAALYVVLFLLVSNLIFPREFGVMGNPKYTSVISLSLLVIPLLVFIVPEKPWTPLLPILTGVFLFTSDSWAVFGTGIALHLVGLLMMFLKGDPKRVRQIFISASFLALIITAGYAFKGPELFRATTWRNVQIMISERPRLGVGLGQFEIHYPAYANRTGMDPEVNIGTFWAHPHNEMLLIAVERGMIGLLAWLFLMFSVFSSRKTYDRYNLALGFSLMSTILLSIFWFPLTHPSMAASFWTIAGLYVGYESKNKS